MSLPKVVLDVLNDPFFKHGIISYVRSEATGQERSFLDEMGTAKRKRFVCLYHTLVMYIRSVLDAIASQIDSFPELSDPDVRHTLASYLVRRDPAAMEALLKAPKNLDRLRLILPVASLSYIDDFYNPQTGKPFEVCES